MFFFVVDIWQILKVFDVDFLGFKIRFDVNILGFYKSFFTAATNLVIFYKKMATFSF